MIHRHGRFARAAGRFTEQAHSPEQEVGIRGVRDRGQRGQQMLMGQGETRRRPTLGHAERGRQPREVASGRPERRRELGEGPIRGWVGLVMELRVDVHRQCARTLGHWPTPPPAPLHRRTPRSSRMRSKVPGVMSRGGRIKEAETDEVLDPRDGQPRAGGEHRGGGPGYVVLVVIWSKSRGRHSASSESGAGRHCSAAWRPNAAGHAGPLLPVASSTVPCGSRRRSVRRRPLSRSWTSTWRPRRRRWSSPRSTHWRRLAPSDVVAQLRSLPAMWADTGPDGRRALATAVFATIQVEVYQTMEYTLTPEAIELGLQRSTTRDPRGQLSDR